MKGTILDLLKLASEKPELAKDLFDLAAKYGFEFADEVSDQQLDDVVGGADSLVATASLGEPMDMDSQDAMNNQSQTTMQIVSNIMKNQHDTLKTIINNMR